jgi:competence ComEA-like helix-hairpin-helix protein
MSPEHRAVLALLGVGLAGHAVRATIADSSRPPGEVRLVGGANASAVLARRDSLARLARPLGPAERVDVDRATAPELARLPGVGPGMARRIVDERGTHGPFADIEGLSRVRGVGPALLERLAPHLMFAGHPSAAVTSGDTTKARRAGRGKARRTGVATAPIQAGDPLVTEPRTSRGRGKKSEGSSAMPGDVLNQGTVAQLDQLPGVGRVRAEHIVAFRDSVGPFRSPSDLARVPGISLALAGRIWTAAGHP